LLIKSGRVRNERVIARIFADRDILMCRFCIRRSVYACLSNFCAKSPDSEKLSAYECGFNAFDDARLKFDVRFYLVAILLIIFDLEIAFLFPWVLSIEGLGWPGYLSVMIFFGMLTIGLIYEWRKGALNWE